MCIVSRYEPYRDTQRNTKLRYHVHRVTVRTLSRYTTQHQATVPCASCHDTNPIAIHNETPSYGTLCIVSRYDQRNARVKKTFYCGTLHSCECLPTAPFSGKQIVMYKTCDVSNARSIWLRWRWLHYKWVDSKRFQNLGFDVVSTFNTVKLWKLCFHVLCWYPGSREIHRVLHRGKNIIINQWRHCNAWGQNHVETLPVTELLPESR